MTMKDIVVSSASVCQGRGGSKEVSGAELALEGPSSAHCLHAGGTLGGFHNLIAN